MNRRVQALVCACCLFCLTATATAQSPNHHHPPAPPRRGHPKPAQRLLLAPQWVEPFVDLAPSQAVPTAPAPAPAAAQPSSIQPQPPPLLPPTRGSANGTLRLDVEPPSTQVFVDGFFAGSVAEINDRGLALGAGWHRLVFRSPGYETASANVTVEPNRATTYHLAWHR